MRAETIIIICALAGGVGYYAYSQRQQSIEKEATLNADRAVRVLPEGTQDAWIAYVERRVASAVQSKAGLLALRGNFPEITFVSRNTPFKVTCDPIVGGSIVFGFGEGSVTVPIYGWFDDENAEPPLKVNRSSVAAADLSIILCEHISASVSKSVQP